MADAKNLNQLDVPKLKKLIADEGASIPKTGSGVRGNVLKKDLIATIIANRTKRQNFAPLSQPDYLSDLPLEMRLLIASGIDPMNISNLCRTNRQFNRYCNEASFWSYYLTKSTIAESQDFLHSLFIELAKQGDINLFEYLQNIPLVVNRTKLVKERKSIFESYLAALRAGNELTADFIWKFDPEWIQIRTASEVGEEAEEFPNIDYRKEFELKLRYIDLVKNKNIKQLKSLYKSESSKFPSITFAWDYILSYSPDFNVLLAAIDAIDYAPPVNDIYKDIIDHAIENGNSNLVDESEKIFGDKYSRLYRYYLRSPHPEGDRLAFKHQNNKEITHNDAFAIGYRFNNRDILLKYINKHPKDKNMVLINSFRALSEDELINLFPWDECIDEWYFEHWLEELDYYGYDYLINYVKEKIIICKPED
jgi:hypothetical protein